MENIIVALYIRLEREMNQGDMVAARKTIMEIYDLEKETGYIDARLLDYAQMIA